MSNWNYSMLLLIIFINACARFSIMLRVLICLHLCPSLYVHVFLNLIRAKICFYWVFRYCNRTSSGYCDEVTHQSIEEIMLCKKIDIVKLQSLEHVHEASANARFENSCCNWSQFVSLAILKQRNHLWNNFWIHENGLLCSFLGFFLVHVKDGLTFVSVF